MDPVEEFVSPYLFVGNNPISLTDFDGFYSVDRNGGFTYFHAYDSFMGTIKDLVPIMKVFDMDVTDSYGNIFAEVGFDYLTGRTFKAIEKASKIKGIGFTYDRAQDLESFMGIPDNNIRAAWELSAFHKVLVEHSDIFEG